jgi:hypothetical protein
VCATTVTTQVHTARYILPPPPPHNQEHTRHPINSPHGLLSRFHRSGARRRLLDGLVSNRIECKRAVSRYSPPSPPPRAPGLRRGRLGLPMITVPPAAPSELSGWNPALPSPHPLELGLPLDRRTGGVTEFCSERAAASCSLRCGAPAACCSRRLAARVGIAAALLSAS